MGEGYRVVEKMPPDFRERLKQKPGSREMQRGPSKASGFQRLLNMLEGEPFKEILTQPSLRAGQPVDVRWSPMS